MLHCLLRDSPFKLYGGFRKMAMNKKLTLPDPVLIAVRAACARVANLSGAAEQADRILRDMEDITVLADDGSMAELLSSRLSMSTTRYVQEYG